MRFNLSSTRVGKLQNDKLDLLEKISHDYINLKQTKTAKRTTLLNEDFIKNGFKIKEELEKLCSEEHSNSLFVIKRLESYTAKKNYVIHEASYYDDLLDILKNNVDELIVASHLIVFSGCHPKYKTKILNFLYRRFLNQKVSWSDKLKANYNDLLKRSIDGVGDDVRFCALNILSGWRILGSRKPGVDPKFAKAELVKIVENMHLSFYEKESYFKLLAQTDSKYRQLYHRVVTVLILESENKTEEQKKGYIRFFEELK